MEQERKERVGAGEIREIDRTGEKREMEQER